MKRTFATATAMLFAALALPAVAAQLPSASAQSQVDRRAERLQNQVAQLRETLSEGSANRQDAAEAWQERYEQKLAELRERQQFEGRYLSHE